MKETCIKFAVLPTMAFSVTGCAVTNKSMREPYSRVDFTKNDFILSEQVSGEGTCTKVLTIDWYRLFHSSQTGAVAGDGGFKISASSIPVIGGYLSDKTAGYALYDMMNKNQGYDVVFYPQYETRVRKPFLGLGFIYKQSTVKATAKLAKLKP
ncbi:MAG: hypothetical protein H7257_12520 [Taibaiella sp.]|nr:hypothetical protein [Taibaiella sp.]